MDPTPDLAEWDWVRGRRVKDAELGLSGPREEHRSFERILRTEQYCKKWIPRLILQNGIGLGGAG